MDDLICLFIHIVFTTHRAYFDIQRQAIVADEAAQGKEGEPSIHAEAHQTDEVTSSQCIYTTYPAPSAKELRHIEQRASLATRGLVGIVGIVDRKWIK
jgi:hypothetical protein